MGAPFGPKSHVWLVARVPDARLIPERDRSVLPFYFYMSVEIIISRGTLCRGELVKAGAAVEGTFLFGDAPGILKTEFSRQTPTDRKCT